MKKIPTTVITGFLGSGKTSLIRNIIENNDSKKFAFLINEFGDLGIDRDILLGCGIKGCTEDDIIELANGCICCTVADEFLPSMEKILNTETPPDHIIIETSGLALPKPLLKAFMWPEIKSQITIDGVITLIDAKALIDGRFADDEKMVHQQRLQDDNLDHDNPLEELFEDQLACADIILLNKCDLLSEDEVKSLQTDLKPKLRHGTSLIKTYHANINQSVLLGIESEAENDLEARPSHHDGDDD